MSTMPEAMPVSADAAVPNGLLESFKALSATEQAAFLQQATAVHLKTVKAELKAASSQKRKRLTPEEKAAKPKREQPESVKAWINYVKSIQAELGCKYGEAMAEASKRREAGDPAAPVAAKKKDTASVLSKEEKASIRSAAKEAKQAAAAEAKAAKQAAAAEAKAAKQAAAAAEKAAKEAAKLAEKQAKEVAKAEAAAAKAAAKAKPAAAPAPAPAPAAAQEEEALTEFKHAGKTYWRSSANECWLKAADGTLGAWAGIWTGTKMDASAPEPALA